MNEVLIALAAAGTFFAAMGLRGVFGYLKNDKISIGDIKFDWKKFLLGSIKPVALTLSIGALAALIMGFFQLVAVSGVPVDGIDQISVTNLIAGLLIADVLAIGLAVKEAFFAFGLSEKQISQIREAAAATGTDESLGLDIQYLDGEFAVVATNVKHDAGTGETYTEAELPQLGAFPYRKVDVSTPDAFYNAVIGEGFNEGYGLQCVAGFKEHQYSLSGKIVATSTGAASGYATQKAQIEALGYTRFTDKQLQNGDWVIFGINHVAMYYNGKFLGQNQGAANANVGNNFNLANISLDSYLCHYRPNIYKKAASTTTTTKTLTVKTTTVAPVQSYTVKKGDTLGQLILDNGWGTSAGLWGANGDVARIAKANAIADPNKIKVGQVIKRA